MNEKALFDEGLNAAKDPSNSAYLKGGAAITSLDSSWLHTECERCNHSFRNGDPVFIETDGKVYHNSTRLACSGKQEGESNFNPEDILEFNLGIVTTYPPPANIPIEVLREGHTLLAPPLAGLKRHKCAICGHTLRQNDIVVLCPCHPESPKCFVSIHWDPFKGLNCWGEWNSNQDQLYCPATSSLVKYGR
ncbi:MAG: hypothetical protein IT260_00900 [Saprospiraceae bacterium]|nr:hypothetical protein [Saprospiraceae bacterium]